MPPAANPTTFAQLRAAFFAGALMLAPLAVTLLVFAWLFEKIGGSFRPLFFFYVPEGLRDHPSLTMIWDILATVIVIVLVTALGFVSRYFLGRYFGNLAERTLNAIPGFGGLYRSVRQIVDTFSAQNRNVFSQVVLVEFPRNGVWSIGFLTNEAEGEVQARTAAVVWTVFIPTTPNPTSGFLVMIPKEDITILDMNVGDAMKLIISGGTVAPPWPAPSDAPAIPPAPTA